MTGSGDDRPIGTAQGLRVRRRKVSKRKPKGGGWRDQLHKAAVIATLAGMAIYGWGVRQQLGELRDQFGPYSMSSDATDLRYQLGNPGQIAGDGRRWTYRNGDRTLIFTLDSAQKVERIECLAATVRIDACPLVRMVGLSSSEADVKKALGWPTAEGYVQSTKMLTYAGLGYRFQLGRDQVQAIVSERPQGGLAYLKAFLWQAVP